MSQRTVLTELVPCVFGPGGLHEVTISLNENQMLDDIKCGCDEARAETEGLILLGTDEMTTCLGIRNTLIKHVSGEESVAYRLPIAYQKTIVSKVGDIAARAAREVRTQRENLARQEAIQKQIAEETDHITDRLNQSIRNELFTTQAEVIEVVRRTINDTRTYVLGSRVGRGYGSPGAVKGIAVRRNGTWVFPKSFREHSGWQDIISDWGGTCGVCCGDGYRGHCRTKTHTKNMEKAIMFAAQVSSRDGMALKAADPEHEFTYRKNSRKLVGIEFMEDSEWNRLYQSIT